MKRIITGVLGLLMGGVAAGTASFHPESLTWDFGSKSVQFRNSGSFQVISNGKRIMECFFYIKTPYSDWITNGRSFKIEKNYNGKSICITDCRTDRNGFLIQGLFAFHKKDASVPVTCPWKMKAELTSANKIRVSLGYTTPDGKQAMDRGFFFQCSNYTGLDAGGVKYSLSELKYSLSEYSNKKPKIGKERIVKVEAGADSILVAYPGNLDFDRWKNGFRLTPYSLQTSFEIDMLDNTEASVERVSAGGVDLKKTDDLELPGTGRNLLPNPYFAQKTLYLNCSTQHRVSFMNCLKDSGSLYGKYHISGDPGIGVTLGSVPVTHGEYTFSFFAKGNGSLTCDMQGANDSFRIRKSFTVDSRDWKRFEFSFTAPPGAGAITPSLALDHVAIDALQLEKGQKATDFFALPVTAAPGNDFFFESGRVITLPFELSTLKNSVSGTAAVSVRNFWGKEIYRGSFDYSFCRGEYPDVKLNIGMVPDGVYVVRIDYSPSHTEFFRFAVMPFLDNSHRTARIFSLGYSGHTSRLRDIDSYFVERLRRIGIGANGHSCAVSEKVRKKYRDNRVLIFDVAVAWRTSSEQYAKLFPGLRIPPGHTFFYIRNFGKALWEKDRALLHDYRLTGWDSDYRKKLRDVIISQVKENPCFAYDIGSEWPREIKDDPHYPEFYKTIRDAIKSVYPDAMVYEAGDCNMYEHGGIAQYDRFLARIAGLTKTDFVSAHAYFKDIRDLYPNFNALLAMTKKHPGYENCPIAIPEGMHYYPYAVPEWDNQMVCWMREGWRGGTLSYDMGRTEKLSAAYYARSYLVYMTAFDRVWCGTSSASNTGNFSLDFMLTPRAFQKIPNTLGCILGNPARYLGDYTFAPDTKCLVWEDEKGRPVAAVWNEDPAVENRLKKPPTARMNYAGAEYIDLMGVAFQPQTDGVFSVSPFPLFVRGRANDWNRFSDAISQAVLQDSGRLPCRVSAEFASTDQLRLILTNSLARRLHGTLTIQGEHYALAIPANGRQEVLVKLSQPIASNAVTHLAIPYQCSIDGQTVDGKFDFSGFAVRRFSGDWNEIPSIKLDNYVDAVPAEKNDFAASFKLAWDKNGLHLRVEVTDDVLAAGTGARYRWTDDIAQVYFDTRCSAMMTGRRTCDDDDYEYGLMPTVDGKRCEVWRAMSPDIQLTLGIAAPKNSMLATEIPAGFTRTSNGYVYEAVFPADYLLPAKLISGWNIGFGLYVSDRDGGKKPKQGLSLATEKGSGCYNKPHLWPVAVLVE